MSDKSEIVAEPTTTGLYIRVLGDGDQYAWTDSPVDIEE